MQIKYVMDGIYSHRSVAEKIILKKKINNMNKLITNGLNISLAFCAYFIESGLCLMAQEGQSLLELEATQHLW